MDYYFKENLKIDKKFLNIRGLCGTTLPINNLMIESKYSDLLDKENINWDCDTKIESLSPYLVLNKKIDHPNVFTNCLENKDEWKLSEEQEKHLKNGDIIKSGIMYGKRKPRLNTDFSWLLDRNIKNEDNKQIRFLWLRNDQKEYSVDANAIEYLIYRLCSLFRINTILEIEKALGYYKGLIGYLEDFKVQIRINYIVVMCKWDGEEWEELPDLSIKPEFHGTPTNENAYNILKRNKLYPLKHEKNNNLDKEYLKYTTGDIWEGQINKEEDKGRVYTTGSLRKAWNYANTKKYLRKLNGNLIITRSEILKKDVMRVKQNEWNNIEKINEHTFWDNYKGIIVSTNDEHGNVLTENYESIYNNFYPDIEMTINLYPAYLDINYPYTLNEKIWGKIVDYKKFINNTMAPWMQSLIDIHDLKESQLKKRKYMDFIDIEFDNSLFNKDILLNVEKLKKRPDLPKKIVSKFDVLFSNTETCDMTLYEHRTEEFMKYMEHDIVYSKDINKTYVKFSKFDKISIDNSVIIKKWINLGFNTIDVIYKIIGIFSEGYMKPKQVYFIPDNLEKDKIPEYIEIVKKIKKKDIRIPVWIKGKIDEYEIPCLKINISGCKKITHN